MLSKNEVCHVSVEKEALAIVEIVRKWERFLTGRHFAFETDQRLFSFVYNAKNHGTN